MLSIGQTGERFDPDNLQLLELDNGIPMLLPRYRNNQTVGTPLRGQRNIRNQGILGIPQMVAAGLLPTTRALIAQNNLTTGENFIRARPVNTATNNNAYRTRTNIAAANNPPQDLVLGIGKMTRNLCAALHGLI